MTLFWSLPRRQKGVAAGTMPGGYCRNSETWGSPDAVKVRPPHLGPPRRHSRPRHKTGRWSPPSGPRRPDEHGIDNQGKGPGDPPRPPRPGRRHGGPGDPGARQEARLTPGNQPPAREEDKLTSPGWKLLEDLGAKKMEALRGRRRKNCQSLSALHGKGGRPHLPPLRKILGREEATSPLKKNPEGFSSQNPSDPKAAPVVSP